MASNRKTVLHRDHERARQVLALRGRGHTFREIGARLEISHQRAWQIWQREIREAAKGRRDHAEHELELALQREEEILRACAEIIYEPCIACEGKRVYRGKAKRFPPPFDELGVCERCKGSGYLYLPAARQGAMQTAQRSNEMIAKLLGLFEPTRIRFEGERFDFTEDVALMSPEGLEKDLRELLAEIHASPEAWENLARYERGELTEADILRPADGDGRAGRP